MWSLQPLIFAEAIWSYQACLAIGSRRSAELLFFAASGVWEPPARSPNICSKLATCSVDLSVIGPTRSPKPRLKGDSCVVDRSAITASS